jgi:RES domain/HEPN/RES N-terminal domain 1
MPGPGPDRGTGSRIRRTPGGHPADIERTGRDEMRASQYLYQHSERKLCLRHIQDNALRKELEWYLGPGGCDFCHRRGEAEVVEFDEFMELVMSALLSTYNRASDEGVPREDGDWTTGTATSEELVEDVCASAVDWDVCQAAIAQATPEDWVDRDYEWPRPEASLREGWEQFCLQVKHHSRFAFLAADLRPGAVFGEYSPKEMLDQISTIALKLDMVRTVPAGTVLWRSRATAGPLVCTAASMGAPPPGSASPNRMSPAGIPMFYGARDPATARREVLAHRAPAAGRLTTCGFEFTRETRLLDVTRMREMPSVFDTADRGLRPFVSFMTDFAKDLSKPIHLDGREHIDYAPTQVLTEYLRYLSPLGVDGMCFSSAQTGGTNHVVFSGAEGCAERGQETSATVLVRQPGTTSHEVL